jgi:PmbA protein
MMKALELAENMIQRALKSGCDSAEVFMKNSHGTSVEAKDGKVEALEASRDFGLALKVIKNRKLGFSFTTECEDNENIIQEAIQGADWTASDEYMDIPDYLSPSDVSVFDERINEIKEEEVIQSALMLEESAVNFDESIKKVRKAEVSVGVGRTTIVNSRGVTTEYDSSYCSAHVTTLAQSQSNDSQMGWDYAASRRMADIDVSGIGKCAAKRAIDLLGSRKITPVKAPVILSESVAVDFLGILSASLSAEAVQKKRSFLANKIGQIIISPHVDIIDDGTMPWKTGTSPVDDEGVPSKNKTLISQGILNGYIHNTYTAKKDNIASTGNAVRHSSKSLPGVGATNLFIKSGARPQHEIIKSLTKGILILGAMGVHTANPISGDFSVGISGLWIENGNILYPVKEAVISGNILELFNRVEEIGNDLRFYGSIGSPSLLIGDMDISA